MRILTFIVGLLFILHADVQQYNDPYADVTYFQLENGLEVYLLSDEKAEKTKITMKVKVGSAVEDTQNLGLSHLVEHVVFRDQRIPHRDYLDYIKEEGGTYVNGYTKRYETGYLATIDSNRSYWIVGLFAQMLFDKNVTTVDLESEKGAVQTEIGDYRLSEVLLAKIAQFSKAVSPRNNDIYRDDFGLIPEPELPARYFAKQNNVSFSLDQVMQHYKAYYYPSNMKLIVVGRFDVEKMKQLIETDYGLYRNSGTKTVVKPLTEPRLSHRPYYRFVEGMGKSYGHIGAKYILSDYKKYLVLDAYTKNAALRIQQHLRNKLGNTYSVSALHATERKASLAGVSFDGLHDDFETNLHYVQQKLKDDVISIDDATIEAALNAYATQVYAYKEHDIDSLMQRVDVVEYLRDEHSITDKTGYEIFSSITNDDFRKIIKAVFVPENEYKIIFRDYYFFMYDVQIFMMLILILYALVYFKISRIDYYQKGLQYTKRDICFDRRLSNRFLGFLIFVFIFLLSSVLWEWVKYLLSSLLMGDAFYLNTIDIPYSYIVTVGDALVGLVVFVIVYRYMFHYEAYMDVTKDRIYIVGNRITVIDKEMIDKIEVTPWHLRYFFKIKGMGLLFWRALIKVEMKDGRSLYLRTSAPDHLKEDLEKCLK